jgi:site-specific DNA-methyltransferase (adenine-specific)
VGAGEIDRAAAALPDQREGPVKGEIVLKRDMLELWRGDAAKLPVPDGAAACIVTSPPYNVGINYDGDHAGDGRAFADYWADAEVWAQEMARVLGDTGRLWLNVAPVVAEAVNPAGHHSGRCSKARAGLLPGWINLLEGAGMSMVDIVAWTGSRGAGTAWGSWETPSAPNLRGDWESIILMCKGSWVRTPPSGYEHWRDPLGGWPQLTRNVWRFAPESRTLGHPAPFPVELATRAIRLSTWPGELVVDPFVGSGTTLVAADLLGRRGVGVERSDRYCRIARSRLSQGVLPLFASEEQPIHA